MRRLRTTAPLMVAVALILPASASAASQTLTVEKTGTGTVTSLPFGIECGATCAAPFAEGTNVLLLAYPGPNSQAVTWSGCDSISEGNCKVTMNSARKVSATFAPIQRQLTVTKAGMGSGTVTSSPGGINCGATCQATYDQGTSVILTGSPSLGSEAVKWSGCDSVDVEDKCTVAINAAKSVTATFSLPPKQLSVTKAGTGTGTVTSFPAGISCGATCSGPFEGNSSVTLTGTPGPNSLAPTWAGCDSTPEGKCVVAISAAKAVTATFGLVSHQLSVAKSGEGGPSSTITSSPAGISCGGTCQASFEHNTTVTLTATPGPHVKAPVWSGCTQVVLGKCKVTMSEAKSVSAGFELEAGYAFNLVTIQKAGTGQGTVSSSPGQILCGALCSDRFLTQTVLTLTATPAPGSAFAHWYGGGCKGAAPCTTTVKAEKTVKAIFTAVGTRTLSVTRAGTGQGTVTAKAFGIDCGSSCSAQIPAAKALVLSAKAAKGSTFAGWSGACSGTVKTCKVKMTEAKGVTATFSAPQAPPPAPCIVPALKGKSLKKAKAALQAAHCALGRVSRPKARSGRKPALVVRSFSPAAGSTLAAGATVDVRLGRAKKHRRG